MQIITDTPNLRPLAARKTVKPVNFYCHALEAKAVYLVGDFNNWNPRSHPMKQQADGWWLLQVPLTHGHHRYRFLVDGKPTLDAHATGVATNEAHEQVSLLAVS
jgi:1,4-alpha-glucan branching enzyme